MLWVSVGPSGRSLLSPPDVASNVYSKPLNVLCISLRFYYLDLATAAKDAQKRHNSINLFKGEYEVDRYIAHLRKPLVSLWHGIVSK